MPCATHVILVSGACFRGWSHGPCHRSAGSGGSAEIVPGRFRVGMAQIWTPPEQQSRRFVASMSPRSHLLTVLKIPRGDGAILKSPRTPVTQIRGLDVATLAPFCHSGSWRARVTRISGLEVAALAPFRHSRSQSATVTGIRGLEVATLAPFGQSTSWRADSHAHYC